MKIIAVRYVNSRIVEAVEFHSAADALGRTAEWNYQNVQVGYGWEWTVYLVDDSEWFQLDNRTYSGARYDFIRYLEDGDESTVDYWKINGIEAKNFRAIDQKDF